MRVSYCERWNNRLAEPIEPISEEEARRRYEKGPWFTVVIGDPPIPHCFIEINWENDYMGVNFLDEAGSTRCVYAFTRVDDSRMFLDQATFWQYPKDGKYHPMFEAELIEAFFYRQDGTATHEVRDEITGEVTLADHAGVPLDINWEPVPEFGDWASVARRDREKPGALKNHHP